MDSSTLGSMFLLLALMFVVVAAKDDADWRTCTQADVPIDLQALCSQTEDSKACMKFLSAFPESRAARSLQPLLELYIKDMANKTEEAKPLIALLYKKQEVRKSHMCLGDCLATKINDVSKALAAFSTTVDINDKFIKMDHFLQRFLRVNSYYKCEDKCPITSASVDEITLADKFQALWNVLEQAGRIDAHMFPTEVDDDDPEAPPLPPTDLTGYNTDTSS
ncbi:hypothetical protein GUJ93_ZPchr0011g28212 [Zizania palustris]|uniref:Pectinesterase inhibitor domain-containing protein n=1 Tax=Zizania palustris TaxID=103762 RepID=A0A8J6BLP0_ZIZPA|nr:hypothetical protein GUJ93_ZPchr0011g28212 [Zizania palustris]